MRSIVPHGCLRRIVAHPANTLLQQDKRDKTQDPLKFAQDQEITRFAFHDSYKGRDEDRYISEIAAIDSTLCGKWGVLKDLLGHWKSKGDKVGHVRYDLVP